MGAFRIESIWNRSTRSWRAGRSGISGYRDSNQDGLPEYRHGNEAGWDNATVFDEGGPIESPDLSAYLSVQIEGVRGCGGTPGTPG